MTSIVGAVLQGVHYAAEPRGGVSIYTIPSSQRNGHNNRGYLGSPSEESNGSDSFAMRPRRNGYENRAYIKSQNFNRSPSPNNNSYPISSPSGRTITHDPNRYSQQEDFVDGKKSSSCSRKRLCYAAIAVILALVIIGVAIFLALFFGKDLSHSIFLSHDM